MDVRVGLWRRLSAEELMLLNCGVGEDSWEFLGLQGDPTSPSQRKSVLNIHWKDWWWSWNSNSVATSCKKPTHWKRPWCWKRLKAGGEGDDIGWDGWMAPPTQWSWDWANSWNQWSTQKPGTLQSMGLQRIRHNLATEQQQQGWDQRATDPKSLLCHDKKFGFYSISTGGLLGYVKQISIIIWLSGCWAENRWWRTSVEAEKLFQRQEMVVTWMRK